MPRTAVAHAVIARQCGGDQRGSLMSMSVRMLVSDAHVLYRAEKTRMNGDGAHSGEVRVLLMTSFCPNSRLYAPSISTVYGFFLTSHCFNDSLACNPTSLCFKICTYRCSTLRVNVRLEGAPKGMLHCEYFKRRPRLRL